MTDNGNDEREQYDATKQQAQETLQELAALEADTEIRKKELKEKHKSLQKQLGGANKGFTKTQLKQAEADALVIDEISGIVNEHWNNSKEAIIKAAKVLYNAKLGIKKIHGASWSFMVEKRLPFGKKTADRLVEIGGCEFISTNIDDLPAAYTTLYEIAKMPEEMRQKAFDDNKINADSWRRDILDIVSGEKAEIKKAEEDAIQVRTVPIGILNVPERFFQEEQWAISKGKKMWSAEAVKLFQAECMQALKGLMEKYKVDGAPNMIDFSKINETLEKQEERLNKTQIIDHAKEQKKVCDVVIKEIKKQVKNQESWRQKYTGSKEKEQNMYDDLFSNYDLHSLVWSLKEVSDPDFGYWKSIETPIISAEYLQQLSNQESVMAKASK